MKRVRCFLCAVLLLGLSLPLLASEEKPKPLSQEQLEAIAIQPASNWGKGADRVVPEMLALFKEEEIQISGKTSKYLLYSPETLEDGKKYPMILWLHGAGETGSDNKSQLIHLHHIITSLTGEKKRDFFLLVPQCPPGTSWSYGGGSTYQSMAAVPHDVRDGKKTLEEYKQELLEHTKAASEPGAEIEITEEKAVPRGVFGLATKDAAFLRVTVTSPENNHPLEAAFAMVEQASGKYPVDRNRITVSGLSTGGDGTWRALERRPDLFAAAVPLVSWSPLTDEAMEKSPILKKIPIWAIYSSDDRGIDTAREGFERVEKAGANVKKTEFGICGHTAWTPAMLQADIFAWLLSRAKEGNRFYAVFDPGVNPDDMKGIVDVATRDPGKPALAPAPPRAADVSPPVVPTVPSAIMIQERMEQQRASQLQEQIHLRIDEVRQPQRMAEYVLPDGTRVVRQVPVVVPSVAPSPEKDAAYGALAERYFVINAHDAVERRIATLEVFKNCFKKMSPQAQMELILRLVGMAQSIEALQALEELLDGVHIPLTPRPLLPGIDYPNPPTPVIPAQAGILTRDTAPLAPRLRGGDGSLPPPRAADVSPPVVPISISAERIIEECNRPWAMTSESLYGMFPADWHKEAEAIPDFIVNSNTDDLAKTLAQSVSADPESKDFVAACRSILLLTHKPMSSPWFETSGGRLRSEIQYSLSPKGQMFVRFLRTVKESGNNSDKARELSKVAEKMLEKIEMVLEK